MRIWLLSLLVLCALHQAAGQGLFSFLYSLISRWRYCQQMNELEVELHEIDNEEIKVNLEEIHFISIRKISNHISREFLSDYEMLSTLYKPEFIKCNFEENKILRTNAKATCMDIIRPWKAKDLVKMRRADRIIIKILEIYAIKCLGEFRPQLDELIKKVQADKQENEKFISCNNFIDEVLVEILKKKVDASGRLLVINNEVDNHRKIKLVNHAKDYNISAKDEAIATGIVVYLRGKVDENEREYLNNFRDGQKYKAKVFELLEQYVFSNCKFLKNTFESVLAPANLAHKMHPEGTGYNQKSDEEVLYWLYSYEFCEGIMEQEERLKETVFKKLTNSS